MSFHPQADAMSRAEMSAERLTILAERAARHEPLFPADDQPIPPIARERPPNHPVIPES